MKTERTYIIAEAGVNHNGSLDMALRLIDVAVEAGADAVKFQTFRAESLVNRSASKAEYQIKATGSTESQYQMLKNLELDDSLHLALDAHCRVQGIQFLSTPFDEESLFFLVQQIGVPLIKVSSGEITNGPLLLAAAGTGRPIILSTGMSTLQEVNEALEVMAFGYLEKDHKPSQSAFRLAFKSESGQQVLKEKVTLLHCTTEYPAPITAVNLRAMDSMREAFGLAVGFSDHTSGMSVAIAAVARGASIIEKHFTLDRELPGPDHRASLEPHELRAMVGAIREVELALGSGVKEPSVCEMSNLVVARRSLVASCDIERDEIFTRNNVTSKRPGIGISPMLYWDVLGRKAPHNFSQDEAIET
ncbi:MAG: N-acetylneuraminate synthase [Proteobacteria bacterium]|nr:N-acetylneuraminate synthase [Pseudomonadota bacterium]MBU1688663.1 N-acetylneuraminate synthase [Pseudomonadota bacterium]